jgi:ribosomal protein L30E|tara:strand:+ start:215 stop:508 length:294 start_codon:yes stop_codon:yes gene_type:complete
MISEALSTGDVPSVFVETSSNGGLSSEQLARLCSRKLIYVSDNAPPEIREQARAYKLSVESLVLGYIKEAMRSERDRCVQIALTGGYNDLADLLRRA